MSKVGFTGINGQAELEKSDCKFLNFRLELGANHTGHKDNIFLAVNNKLIE
jgi:hypothetical protein